jgi:hypothetical protein
VHKENSIFFASNDSNYSCFVLPMYPISNFRLVWISLLTFYWLPSIHHENARFEMSLFLLSNPCSFMNPREATLSKLPNLLNFVIWTMKWQRMLILFWRKIILCYVSSNSKSSILWYARLFLRRGVQLLSVHSTSQSST